MVSCIGSSWFHSFALPNSVKLSGYFRPTSWGEHTPSYWETIKERFAEPVENEALYNSKDPRKWASLAFTVVQKNPYGRVARLLQQKLSQQSNEQLTTFFTAFSEKVVEEGLLGSACWAVCLDWFLFEKIKTVAATQLGAGGADIYVNEFEKDYQKRSEEHHPTYLQIKLEELLAAVSYMVDLFFSAFRRSPETLWDLQAIISIASNVVVVPLALYNFYGLFVASVALNLLMVSVSVLGLVVGSDYYLKYGPPPVTVPNAENLTIQPLAEETVLYPEQEETAIKALADGQSVLFKGPSGAGKTTLIHQMAHKLGKKGIVVHQMTSTALVEGFTSVSKHFENLKSFIRYHYGDAYIFIDEFRQALGNENFVAALQRCLQEGNNGCPRIIGTLTDEEYAQFKNNELLREENQVRFKVVEIEQNNNHSKKALQDKLRITFEKQGIYIHDLEGCIEAILKKGKNINEYLRCIRATREKFAKMSPLDITARELEIRELVRKPLAEVEKRQEHVIEIQAQRARLERDIAESQEKAKKIAALRKEVADRVNAAQQLRHSLGKDHLSDKKMIVAWKLFGETAFINWVTAKEQEAKAIDEAVKLAVHPEDFSS